MLWLLGNTALGVVVRSDDRRSHSIKLRQKLQTCAFYSRHFGDANGIFLDLIRKILVKKAFVD